MSDPIQLFFLFGAKYANFLVDALLIVAFVLQSRDRKKGMLFLGIAAPLLIFGFSMLLGEFYYNPRPFVVENIAPLIHHAPNNGFPSHHTLMAAAMAAVITPFALRLGILAWLVTFWIGISRVYVRVHHMVDIFAAITIAILVTALLYLLFKRLKWIPPLA